MMNLLYSQMEYVRVCKPWGLYQTDTDPEVKTCGSCIPHTDNSKALRTYIQIKEYLTYVCEISSSSKVRLKGVYKNVKALSFRLRWGWQYGFKKKETLSEKLIENTFTRNIHQQRSGTLFHNLNK